jgi:hypothetical protein
MGMMFKLQQNRGTVTLKIVDKDGKDIPCGNVLSIDQYGFLVLHGGVLREQDMVVLDRSRGEIVNRRDRDRVTLTGRAADNLPPNRQPLGGSSITATRFGGLSEAVEMAAEEDEAPPLEPDGEMDERVFSMPPPLEPEISITDWARIAPDASTFEGATETATRTIWNPWFGDPPTLRRRS